MAYEYLESLNPEQTEAVIHSGSPLLILAGAGSGKTRVITTKIAYLIQHENIQPWQILAVTFTKKAANEMRERAVKLEPLASDSVIKTFHSFGAWFLRRHSEEASLDPNFTVYDDDDSATLMQKAIPSLTKKQANSVVHRISLCKDYCLCPEDDLSDFDKDGELAELYAAYEKRLKLSGNADFGDLIMKCVQVLESHPEIRKQMQHRFRVIMVDEYQDSNVAQFRLLQALSGIDENSGTYVCVVGDDDQSIYKFRGAEVQNILGFANHFPGTKLIRLERNYRSMGKILAAADAVVSNNTDRLGKTLVAERGEGAKPLLAFMDNQDEEAAFCSSLITRAVQEGAKYSDFAILYRTNAQSFGFENEFLHKHIPYTVVGSLKFYEREEIKDVLAYLSMIANQKDEIAFTRIVNKPVRGIGEKSREKIIELAHATAGALIEDLNLISACQNCSENLPKKAKEGVKDFAALINDLKSMLLEKSLLAEDDEENGEVIADRLSIFVEKLIENSGLEEYHRSQDEVDGTSRVQNMNEIVNSAMDYPCTMQGLLDFLDSIELDRSLAEDTEEGIDSVTLITLHNTKGLEFNRVIITGLENGIFPREDKIGEELEEERRLFYVGITRAKNELYITSCKSRRLYGHYENMMPSRFLMEAGDVFKVIGKIPLVYSRNVDSSSASIQEDLDLGPKAELLKKWCKGTRLYHDDYGYGQIISSNADNGEVVITVQFETGEKKKFMPEYQGRKLDIIRD